MFQVCIAYFFVIFGIKHFMKNRAPFDLTLPLNIWNAALAIFSITGTFMLYPEFVGTIRSKGFQGMHIALYQIPNRSVRPFLSQWLYVAKLVFYAVLYLRF